MGAWSSVNLLGQNQSAQLCALASLSENMTLTISVDYPQIEFVSVWDGEVFANTISLGDEFIAGYALSVGNNEVSVLMTYICETDVVSTLTFNSSSDVKEASVTVSEA